MSDVVSIALVNTPDHLERRLTRLWPIEATRLARPDHARRFEARRSVVYIDDEIITIPNQLKQVVGCLVILADVVDNLMAQAPLFGGEAVATERDSDEDLRLIWEAWQRGNHLASPTISGTNLYRLYGHTLRAAGRARCRQLSRREIEVLDLLLNGDSNADIAAALHIGERTVESHVRQILQKHGHADRVALLTGYLSGPRQMLT